MTHKLGREDKQHNNTGRPKKLPVRDEYTVFRTITRLREQRNQYSSKRIQEEANLSHVSTRTVRHCLHKHGYHYRQARKKGLFTKNDKVKRLAFARKILPAETNFWKYEIAIYFDGVDFSHKCNPHVEA